MIRHVPFSDLNEQHLDWIAESVLVQPEEIRASSADFLRAIMQEKLRLFDWESGCLIVGIHEHRLILHALCCHDLLHCAVQLADDLKRLAADWECDAVETTCFDTRLTSVIEKLGGRVESVTLVLPVE